MLQELIKQCDKGMFRVNRMYLKNRGEEGYWLYRFLRPILKVRYGIFRRMNKPAPWLSPTSILFFKKYLKSEMVGAEFGSGSSTLFFAPRISKLYSVEHNKEWYDSICNKLKESGLNNVDYRFVLQNEKDDFKNASFHLEDSGDYEVRRDYVNYFRALNDIEDATLDFAIVDGRARTECCMEILPKIKKGGILILDNSERDRYNPVFNKMKNESIYKTTNGLTNTTFWFLK
jgi:predicted O-methyltransferase YrrM